MKPPKGFEDYFGAPPYYRFLDFQGEHDMYDQTLEKIREFPEGSSAEDTMRRMTVGGELANGKVLQAAMTQLLRVIEEDPEIEVSREMDDGCMRLTRTGNPGIFRRGCCGSESCTRGAASPSRRRPCAAHQGNSSFVSRNSRLTMQCAVFFGGWPPLKIVGDVAKSMLADECDEILDVPSCHIVGSKDPWIDGSMALYNMCDEDAAILFDHGKGHTVPRDATTIRELAASIGDAVEKASAMADVTA